MSITPTVVNYKGCGDSVYSLPRSKLGGGLSGALTVNVEGVCRLPNCSNNSSLRKPPDKGVSPLSGVSFVKRATATVRGCLGGCLR